MSSKNEECCRDELFMRLIEYGVDGLPDFEINDEIEFFLDWARRREEQVAGWLAETLNAVATGEFENTDEIQRFASRMLTRYRGKEVKVAKT
ncbi:MAG: hypothetical protein GY841_15750 [FCB group bacterium]|nr:hypothetical protein [FCB group bacterium]